MAYRILRYMFSCLIKHVRPMVYTHRAIGCERANLWFKALNSTPTRKGDWKSHANFINLPTLSIHQLYQSTNEKTLRQKTLHNYPRQKTLHNYTDVQTDRNWPFLYDAQSSETQQKTLHNYPFPIPTNEKKSDHPGFRSPEPCRTSGQKLTAKVTEFTWQGFENVIQ